MYEPNNIRALLNKRRKEKDETQEPDQPQQKEEEAQAKEVALEDKDLTYDE